MIAVYNAAQSFPRNQILGLTSQTRRAAVPVPSNIVEGCARRSEPECLRFLDMAYGSARMVEHQTGLSRQLGFVDAALHEHLQPLAIETAKVLNGFHHSLRKP